MPKRRQVVPVMTVGEGETNQLKNIYFRKEILALSEYRLHIGLLVFQRLTSINTLTQILVVVIEAIKAERNQFA